MIKEQSVEECDATEVEEGDIAGLIKQFILAVCTFCKLFYAQNELIIHHAPHMHEHTAGALSDEEKESIIAALKIRKCVPGLQIIM